MTRTPKTTLPTTKTTAGTWPPETQARALDLYTTQGLAEAHRQLAIPKSTIRRWAAAAGLDAAASAARSVDQTREATVSSLARRHAAVAEASERIVARLAEVAERSLELELELLDAHLRVVRAARRGSVSQAAAARLEAVLTGHPLRAVVGSRTRAVHDLRLLQGEATEQPGASGLTIVFSAPAPTAGRGPDSPSIIDLTPMET